MFPTSSKKNIVEPKTSASCLVLVIHGLFQGLLFLELPSVSSSTVAKAWVVSLEKRELQKNKLNCNIK